MVDVEVDLGSTRGRVGADQGSAWLLMCTEAGTEAHSIVDNTPSESGEEAWRRLVQTFDLASAQAKLNLEASQGYIENILFLIEKREEIVRRQDERTGRKALTDDTKRAAMMDMCPAGSERDLVLNPGRFGAYRKVKSTIRNCVE